MKKITVELFIHLDSLGQPLVSTTDMRGAGFPLVAIDDVEVSVPDYDFTEAKVDALLKQAKEMENEATKKAEKLRSKAEELRSKARNTWIESGAKL